MADGRAVDHGCRKCAKIFQPPLTCQTAGGQVCGKILNCRSLCEMPIADFQGQMEELLAHAAALLGLA